MERHGRPSRSGQHGAAAGLPSVAHACRDAERPWRDAALPPAQLREPVLPAARVGSSRIQHPPPDQEPPTGPQVAEQLQSRPLLAAAAADLRSLRAFQPALRRDRLLALPSRAREASMAQSQFRSCPESCSRSDRCSPLRPADPALRFRSVRPRRVRCALELSALCREQPLPEPRAADRMPRLALRRAPPSAHEARPHGGSSQASPPLYSQHLYH